MEPSNLQLVLYGSTNTNPSTPIDNPYTTPSQYTADNMDIDICMGIPGIKEEDATDIGLYSFSDLEIKHYIDRNDSGSWYDGAMQVDVQIPYTPTVVVDDKKYNANTYCDLSLSITYGWGPAPLLPSSGDYKMYDSDFDSDSVRFADSPDWFYRPDISWDEEIQVELPEEETADPDECLLANICIEDLIAAGHIREDGGRSRYCDLDSGVVSEDSPLYALLE
ncbi:hypothetical protein K440DRAFT_628675 [Wilcoxina mikolae CBS 423.85]|nr:hypothetical protein K440DRAFT_628675 [Wilcoxina mikolae CBS 423.85]